MERKRGTTLFRVQVSGVFYQGDFVRRLRMKIAGLVFLLLRVICKLTKSLDPPSWVFSA